LRQIITTFKNTQELAWLMNMVWRDAMGWAV